MRCCIGESKVILCCCPMVYDGFVAILWWFCIAMLCSSDFVLLGDGGRGWGWTMDLCDQLFELL